MPNLITLIKGCRLAALAAGLALIPAASATASTGVALAPYVGCVHFNGDPANPVYTAYFGYSNTGGARFMFPIDGVETTSSSRARPMEDSPPSTTLATTRVCSRPTSTASSFRPSAGR